MPLSLETPVLQVDANVIHKVDTANPENLFSMWTVFARCRDSVAQGRRLENLSWRLWNRETFCCESGESMVQYSATSQPRHIERPRDASNDDLPQLSGSVDSVADEEAVDFTSESAPLDILRPRIRRQDSCASSRSRGKERHITSDDLEKMVLSIVEAKVPLNAPLPNISLSPPEQEKLSRVPEPERTGSTTTESPCETSETPSMESLQPAALSESATQRTTIVTLGFSPTARPACRITSQASQTSTSSPIPEPDAAPAPKIVQPKKQQAKFDLGGSSGSGEDSYTDRSLDARRQPVPPPKKAIFQIGRESSEAESSLKSALHPARQGSLLSAQKKTASFSNQLVTQTYTSAISDGEQSDTDYVDESAIDDDDDSSDWEDSIEDSGKSSVEDKFNFQRVDSKPDLTSRRSLITLMLAQGNRSQRLGNNASQSTSALPRARNALNGPSLVNSPNDSDEAPLMMKRGTRAPPMRPINEVPRSTAQPINVTATGMNHQAALSPRTTRRNMLATELTESLRRQLLWERSQKSSTANAVLKRRHTSHDVANLKQYPERPYMNRANNDANAGSWDQYFNKDTFTGYHAQGW
ncbi:hypothetical protein QBC34DRAFT_176577 [Podospora aff. communis PSN243]|uniref:Nitrogen regulatory protein areA GATA-like domain-containing protein n=1 Tax=Podospora aff. communis PSN243 TaxID=3040156 RepID=A0AAV9GYJ0_9PEZI|nr:hypothetical protein QBC34DRAFT_176577 [Podospora aff. communis PSN243]